MTDFRDRIGFGGERYAAFASDPARTRGRLIDEPASPTRTPFQRDRDRIIHSAGFRRLAYKTQVFIVHEGDHFRSRLTHTIEVSQIARALARALRLNEDLAEALALGHDLGHTPFGHAGERALNAVMAPWGGFDHNAQTLRLVTKLETPYADFDGLNLSWETLEGFVKHNGPLTDANGTPLGHKSHDGTEFTGLPYAIRVYQALQGLQLHTHASAEAQVAAIADDIAYDAHDIDDGLRAGLIRHDDLLEVPLLATIVGEVRARHPNIEDHRMTQEITRRLITRMVEDVIGETLRRLDRLRPESADDVRHLGQRLVSFSEEITTSDGYIKTFLFRTVYRSSEVMRVMTSAEGTVRDLFSYYHAHLDKLPSDWKRGLDVNDAFASARRVCDYIAGMTDRYALADHTRLFGTAA
jgi:dGTPase